MADIAFKRIFHPVGHGAFFTEQFIDPVSNIVLYNAVYDCGSITSGMTDRIHHICDEIYRGKRRIDILFLSHFDDDHVNCVDYLVKNQYLNGATIFIPLLKEISFIGVPPYYDNYLQIRNLNNQNNIKVIRVNIDNDDIDRIPDTPTPIEDISADKVINSGTKLFSRFLGYIWYYVPFNICNIEILKAFEDKVKAKDLIFEKLQDPKYTLAPEVKEKIKKIYQEMEGKPKGNTIINFNSLQVLSFPVKTWYCKEYSRYSTCHIYFEDYYKWNRGYTQYKFNNELLYPGSCFYTGDTSANVDMVWTKLMRMIDNILIDENKKKRKLVLYQIPHHGSGNSNDERPINEGRIHAAFTNYGDFWGKCIFNYNFAIDYEIKRKPLILVTEKELTQFEEHWIINE